LNYNSAAPFRLCHPAEEITLSKKHRVLVVEDDEGAYQLLRAALRHLPLDFVNASTGTQAIRLLDGDLPELMFLDIDLPDMHGWQVLEKFKESRRLANVPIIVLTAHKEPVHRVIGSLQSVAIYIQKPFKPDELLANVKQLLHL
jgi:DNA-binding response OmpR family regulator